MNAPPAIPVSGIHQIETVFLLLLAFVIVFSLLARRLNTPYPLVLVIAGLLLGFVPGVPRVTMDPDAVFLVVLPPLLFSAAWNTPWREFRFNLVSIVMLASGLVGFTVLGVTLAAPHVFQGFDWRLGFILGAVVATTDAIAATSIAKRIGLPRRIVDVLEGESLLNDATGLLALEFGLGMLVYGQRPSIASGLLRLAWLSLGGLAIGLVVGFVVDRFERLIEYAPLEIVISLSIPYVAYLLAEEARASGVLAVVACGLFLSRRSAEFFSPLVRLQASAVWEALNFALNGLTFLLIGLQLPAIRAGIRSYDLRSLLIDGAVFSGLLVLLRLLWMFPGAYVATYVRTVFLHQQVTRPPARQIFVTGWTGMRGVVALAAALSLPETLSDGAPFPQRDFIIFLTFSVILVTLVVQGLTLPALIRFLGLAGIPESHEEEQEARRAILGSALAYLTEARSKDSPALSTVYDDLVAHYQERLEALSVDDQKDPATAIAVSRYKQLEQELLKVKRNTALRFRRESRINDETLRRIERELDLVETRLGMDS